MNKTHMSLLSLALSMLMAFGGCGIVDTLPEEVNEPTIRPYYFNFDHGTKYTYWVTDPKHSPAPYTVSMEMEGAKDGCKYKSKPVYECDWEVSVYQSGYYNGYYAIDDYSAHYMGSKLNPTDPVWLDMVAPIKKGQAWEFKYGMDPENVINATITRTGFTAFVPDSNNVAQKYEDIIEVEYLSREDKIVKWFARGVGMIAEWEYDLNGKIVSKKSLLEKELDYD